MKAFRIVFTVIMISAVCAISCEKNNVIEEINLSDEEITSVVRKPSIPIKIKLKGKPYRAIENRPRDGKKCDCTFCFGLCDIGIEVDFDFSEIAVDPNLESNTSRVFFLERLDHVEPEFVIDADLTVPTEALENTEIQTLILNSGTYHFIEEEGQVIYEGEAFTSYGYVDVAHNAIH